MRILHILKHVRNSGNGTTNVAVDLACLQAKAGYEVAVASEGGDYETLLASYGVKHFTLDQRKKLPTLLQLAGRYRTIAQQFQPDIVHAHMMIGMVLAWTFRSGFPYKLVSTVHSEFQRNAILMGLADRVIAISTAVAQAMERRGIPARKLRLVFNGTLDSPRTRSLQDYDPMPLQRPAITTVAGMWKRKGIAELIDAFAQIAPDFPQAHLYLVGHGEVEPFKLKAKATDVADRIHFEGFQPEPQRYLLATDIFVLASHREPFGLVLSEAREAGCAIVASDVDGIPEALDGGKAGVLVPPIDSGALAIELAKLLQDASTLNHWRDRAQQNLAWLSAERVSQETLAIYQEFVK
jgi:glycosyltransferase involved in cell wall biosynthesis